MNMVTDPARIRKNDPGHPEVCTVFAYHRIFSQDSIDEIDSSCRQGKIGCVECKKKLFENLSGFLEPIQGRRKELENDMDFVYGVIEEGAKKAKAVASQTLKEAKDRAGLL